MKRTREALKAWDALQEELDATTTQTELNAWLLREAAEVEKVREAFALDTEGLNSRENAYLVHPRDAWLRRVVEG